MKDFTTKNRVAMVRENREPACAVQTLEVATPMSTSVFLSDPESRSARRGRVEGPRQLVNDSCCVREFSRECPNTASRAEAPSGSFDSFSSGKAGLDLARDDSSQVYRCKARYIRAVRQLCDGFGLFLATLREIFDENAYSRFLSQTQKPRSVESYREFLREWEGGAAPKPRCC